MTMLTLFKPWQSGKDLKTEDYTWDETFMQHKFTASQEQLMKNFNLRYECNDARDDYSTKQQNDKDKSGFFPSWASSDVLKDLDNNSVLDYENDDPNDVDSEENTYTDPSTNHLKKLEEMSQMENIVQNAGWLDKCPQKIDPIDPKGLCLEVNMAGSKWNFIVKMAKDAVLMERGKNIPVNQPGVLTCSKL
jgi:hypothetical protein